MDRAGEGLSKGVGSVGGALQPDPGGAQQHSLHLNESIMSHHPNDLSFLLSSPALES